MNFEGCKPDKPWDKAEQAAAVLDPRLADLWAAIWSDRCQELPIEAVGGLMRIAYLSGYQEALTEPSRGGLFRELGLPVPVSPPVKSRPSTRRR